MRPLEAMILGGHTLSSILSGRGGRWSLGWHTLKGRGIWQASLGASAAQSQETPLPRRAVPLSPGPRLPQWSWPSTTRARFRRGHVGP
jgi:hypothetical protein